MSLVRVSGDLQMDTSNVKIDGKTVDLEIVKISAKEYDRLVKTDACRENTLYVVEDAGEDMHGERIRNLGSGIADGDAVTMLQLKQVRNEILLQLNQLQAIVEKNQFGIDNALKGYLNNILKKPLEDILSKIKYF